MGRPRKSTEEIPEKTVDEAVDAILEEVESPAKSAFRDFMVKYKKQNPAKYALKEASLSAKLETL